MRGRVSERIGHAFYRCQSFAPCAFAPRRPRTCESRLENGGHDGRGRFRQLHKHLRMRSRLPCRDQRHFHWGTESRIRARDDARRVAHAPSRAGDRALAIANVSVNSAPERELEEDFGEGAEISTRGTCAPRSQSVSQTPVQISRSSSFRTRFARRSISAFGRSTAKMVEPEPDISAALTSGCLSSHILSCARKINFSNTGRSRSLWSF